MNEVLNESIKDVLLHVRMVNRSDDLLNEAPHDDHWIDLIHES